MTGLPEDPTRCATIIAAVLGTVFSEHVVRPRIGLHATMAAAYAPSLICADGTMSSLPGSYQNPSATAVCFHGPGTSFLT